jgi:hypothetical protein
VSQQLDFETTVFEKEYIQVAHGREAIVWGDRHLFDRLPAALSGVRQIGVIGRATERALAWSVGLGAPYTFQTTLRSKYVSDLTW